MECPRQQYFNELIWKHEYATRYKYQHVKQAYNITLEEMEEMADDLQRLQRRREKLYDSTISKMQLSNYLRTQKAAHLAGSTVPNFKNDSKIYFKQKSIKQTINSATSTASEIQIPNRLFSTTSGTETRLSPSIRIRSYSKPISHGYKLRQMSIASYAIERDLYGNDFREPDSKQHSRLRALYSKQQENLTGGDVVQLTMAKMRDRQVGNQKNVSTAKIGDDF